jgi:hypothetical protein
MIVISLDQNQADFFGLRDSLASRSEAGDFALSEAGRFRENEHFKSSLF